jgi:GGDEF domain-containing protein
VPVRVDGHNVGVIVFFKRGPAGFLEPEAALLAQVGADVSFGLERLQKDEHIAWLARFDTTTGLPNRTRFLERLDAVLGRSDAPMVAVTVVDVERFRHVCESFGRTGGDLVLAEIAARLRRLAVDADLLARVGPDRFAVAFEPDRRGAEAYVRGVLGACFREPFVVGG